jgi:hypothetical protein
MLELQLYVALAYSYEYTAAFGQRRMLESRAISAYIAVAQIELSKCTESIRARSHVRVRRERTTPTTH